jgi:hypothetical protein
MAASEHPSTTTSPLSRSADDERRLLVERELIGICRSILQVESFDVDRSFTDNGGDSFSTMIYVAEVLRRFGTYVTADAVLGSPSIAALARTLAARRTESSDRDTPSSVVASLSEHVRPRQELVVGSVPLLANRYSYFFKRRRDLEYWNVGTGLLAMREPLDVKAFSTAISLLVTHHDGLRLQLTEQSGRWTQSIVEPALMGAFVAKTYQGGTAGFCEFARHELAALYEGFTFPGPLFRAMHLRHHEGGDLIAVLAHHLVVDAFSFALVLKDLFHLYRTLRLTGQGTLPPKTTSLKDFSEASTEYWLAHREQELQYWSSLPWSRLASWPTTDPPGADANTERHTRYVIRSVPLRDDDALAVWLGSVQGAPLLATLVCAIARAFRSWTGQDVLHLATVFHGREAFLDDVDLSRTIGWISETVPVLVDARPSIPVMMSEALEHVTQAMRRGRSYGVLRYLASPEVQAEMSDHPEPAVSLNVVMRHSSDSAYRDLAFRQPGYTAPSPNKDTTERAFILSGGVYMRDGCFHLSWDFSDRVLSKLAVERFADYCMEELSRCISSALHMSKGYDG